MAKVIPIGSPVNEAERRTIAHLRDNLPDSYILLHNFEVERDGELFEVDLAVIAPHAVMRRRRSRFLGGKSDMGE